MLKEIQELIDNYIFWLKDNTFLREVEDWVEITTPYLDRHNDLIQIYAKKDNGGYVLTDDSYTLNDLELSGCELNTTKRQELLKMTLNGFGVQLQGHSLIINASKDNFAIRKHNLIQAILVVNDLFFTARPYVHSFFLEDVSLWLDSNEIRYTPKVKFTGKSGFDHLFEFVIPKSKSQPERIVQPINNPNKDSAISLAFAWYDTKETRPVDSKAYAFLNDSELEIPFSVIDTLRQYDVKSVRWSERQNYINELAA